MRADVGVFRAAPETRKRQAVSALGGCSFDGMAVRASRWSRGVPVGDRGPGESYRPEDVAPTLFASRQPGITTPVLDHLAFVALDLSCADRGELRAVLEALTLGAERLMRSEHRAQGTPAGGLTLTLGLGPGVFDRRFGLASRRPVGLVALPAFHGDALEQDDCDGDLCVQACARTPEVADAALATLLAAVEGGVRVRWSQRARMHRRAGERLEGRPRNLLGFKEATGNPRRGKDLDRHVWVAGRERSWMSGGTFLVVRKVRVLLDAWDALSLDEQERIIGRQRDNGAWLGRTHEFQALPTDDGEVPADAHARLANPRSNDGVVILRRGYSYDNGPDAHGRPDAGLMLLLYQRDPRRQFIPLQTRLAEHDALTPLTRTVSSAIFAIPPGSEPGQMLAHQLLDVASRS